MERILIGEYEADELLKPYKQILVESFHKGFSDMLKTQSSLDGGVHVTTHTLTKSIQVWDYSLNWAKKLFEDVDGIKYVELANNSCWFNIHDLLFIRFKKLDESLKPSNHQSKRIELIQSQDGEIPGIPAKPTLADVGYQTDKTFSFLKDIHIVCRTNDVVRWKFNLTENNSHQLYIYENKSDAQDNIESILKIKEEFKRKNRKSV
jgi:hypothetical protein